VGGASAKKEKAADLLHLAADNLRKLREGRTAAKCAPDQTRLLNYCWALQLSKAKRTKQKQAYDSAVFFSFQKSRPKRKVHNGRILQFGRLMDNRHLVVQSTIMRSPKGGRSFDPFQRRL
jgi:hypothetical protein